MEFLVLWILTIVLSVCMEVANDLRIYKDIADSGYKIDNEKRSVFATSTDSNSKNFEYLSTLIPGLNMFLAFMKTIQYNNNREELLTRLILMGIIVEMSELEKKEYSKHPTVLNAFLVPGKVKQSLENALMVIIYNDGVRSEIYYEIGESLDDITILKANGPVARLTEEEQKKQIVEILKKLVQECIKKYGDAETFIDALKYDDLNAFVNLDSIEDDEQKLKESSTTISYEDQKNELNKLKSELLGESEEVKNPEKPKEKSLSKKGK